MAEYRDYPDPAAIVFGEQAKDKAALFRMIAERAAHVSGGDPAALEAQLKAREALGSTGFGDGIAIPHGRIDALAEPFTIFVRLPRPVDYESADAIPVDCVFALFSPEADGAAHLRVLARISRLMRDKDFVAKLRGARSSDALYALLTNFEAADAA